MSVLDAAKKELLRTCVTKPYYSEVAQVTKQNHVELAELMNLMRAGTGENIRAAYDGIEWYQPASWGLEASFTRFKFSEWVFFYEHGFAKSTDESFRKRYDLDVTNWEEIIDQHEKQANPEYSVDWCVECACLWPCQEWLSIRQSLVSKDHHG